MSAIFTSPSAVTNFPLSSQGSIVLFTGYVMTRLVDLDGPGSTVKAYGFFNNGIYANGEKLSPPYDPTYRAQDYWPQQNFDDGLFYTYPSGGEDPILANGIKQTGIFENGQRLTTTITTPVSVEQIAINYNTTPRRLTVRNSYYIYKSGAPLPARGAYSNGYFKDGYKSTENIYSPLCAIDDNKFYTYANGNSFIANGYYSTGHFINGIKNTGTNLYTPVTALDKFDNTFYYYISGNAVKVISGAYSNGYFIDSKKSTNFTQNIPINLLDRTNTQFYTFSAGIPLLSNGIYLNGYYVNGNKTTLSAVLLLSGTYFDFSKSPPVLANGSYNFLSGAGRYVNGKKQIFNDVFTPTLVNGKYIVVYDNETINAGGYTLSGDQSLIDTLTSILDKPLVDGKIGFYNNGIYTDGTKLNLLSANLQIVSHATTKVLSAFAPYVYYSWKGVTGYNAISTKITRNAIYAERLDDKIILKPGPVYIHGKGDVYRLNTISVLR